MGLPGVSSPPKTSGLIWAPTYRPGDGAHLQLPRNRYPPQDPRTTMWKAWWSAVPAKGIKKCVVVYNYLVVYSFPSNSFPTKISMYGWWTPTVFFLKKWTHVYLVGGFNPFENMLVKLGSSSPRIGVMFKPCLKPPPSYPWLPYERYAPEIQQLRPWKMMLGRPSFWSQVTFQPWTVELQVGEVFIPNHQAVIRYVEAIIPPKKNSTFGFFAVGIFRKAPRLDFVADFFLGFQKIGWCWGDFWADRRWPIHDPRENPLYSPEIWHRTWKMMVSKRNLLFQELLFRFHVKFLVCILPRSLT